MLLWLANSVPVAAQSAGDYFQVSYGSANLSQSEVSGDGVFYATISGNITCIKDVPGAVSAASITSRVVAKDAVTAALVTLNPNYIVTIEHFPSKAGETADINQEVPLQFPAGSESGNYSVSADIIEAKVKVVFIGWFDVTEYLPESQYIGSIKYISTGISPAPLPPVIPPSPPAESAKPAPQSEPTLPTAPTSSPSPARSQALVESVIPWWVWLLVAIAMVTTLVNVFLMLRNRSARRAVKK